MPSKKKNLSRMFLAAETNDPSDCGTECIYCCVPITMKRAKEFLTAMRMVKEMERSSTLRKIGDVYGVEIWLGARWLVPDGGAKSEAFQGMFNLQRECALLPGTPEDWCLVESRESRFDLQTVVVTRDDVRFQCHYEDSGNQIRAFHFRREMLELAARGEAEDVRPPEDRAAAPDGSRPPAAPSSGNPVCPECGRGGGTCHCET